VLLVPRKLVQSFVAKGLRQYLRRFARRGRPASLSGLPRQSEQCRPIGRHSLIVQSDKNGR